MKNFQFHLRSYLKFLTLFSLCFIMCISCKKTTLPSQDKSTAYLYLQTEPSSLDPRVGGEGLAQAVMRQLFEGLTRIGKDGTFELALAKEYTISDDGLVYTFKLHPSRWSNGDPVTAEDFVYGWTSLLNPKFMTPYCYAFYLIKNARKASLGEIPLEQVGIRALDSHTLEVTLEHQAPYFLEFTSNVLFSPIHKKNAEENRHWASGTAQNSYISNGPFILQERLLKSHIALQKNPTYWNVQDPARVENIRFAIIEDHQTAFNMFQGGHLDWIDDHCGKISLEARRELQSHNMLRSVSRGGIYWFAISTTQPHLRSIFIRRAIAHAINRKEITEHLLQGGETPAYSFIPKDMSMLDAPLFEDNNPKKARQLFEKGLSELGFTLENYPTLVISHRPEAQERLIAEAVQQQLQKNLPISVQLEANDVATFGSKIRSGKGLQMGGLLWYSWYHDPIYNLNHIKYRNTGINASQWENSEYIQCLDMADLENNPLKRREYLKKAETIAMTEMPIIPIFHQTLKYATSKHLHGEVISRGGLLEFKWIEKR